MKEQFVHDEQLSSSAFESKASKQAISREISVLTCRYVRYSVFLVAKADYSKYT